VLRCTKDCNDAGYCHNGTCFCKPGFSGIDCSITECLNNCNSQGYCENGLCKCYPGFTGLDCSQPKCLNDCNQNGRCASSGYCVCKHGWKGPDCSVHDSEIPTQAIHDPITNTTHHVPIPFVPVHTPKEEACREALDAETNARRYRRSPANNAEGGGDWDDFVPSQHDFEDGAEIPAMNVGGSGFSGPSGSGVGVSADSSSYASNPALAQSHLNTMMNNLTTAGGPFAPGSALSRMLNVSRGTDMASLLANLNPQTFPGGPEAFEQFFGEQIICTILILRAINHLLFYRQPSLFVFFFKKNVQNLIMNFL
jgi:hypothetical protein